MTEAETSEINSRANETSGEANGRREKEAWKSGINRTGTEASICCLGVLLTVPAHRPVGRIAHRHAERA
jgi:hypothetical protein